MAMIETFSIKHRLEHFDLFWLEPEPQVVRL